MNERIAVLVGEPSGDRLGAALVGALRRRSDAGIVGIAGPAMQAAGVASLFPMRDIAVMGLVEVLPRLPLILRRMRETVAWLERQRPQLVVTIDSPDFMRPVVARARPRLPDTGFINYVAPSVWAWRPGRVRAVARLYDLQLALLPFEPPWFAAAGLATEFVGHPAVERAADLPARAAAVQELALAPDRPVLVVLPGSRSGEVARLGPVFSAAVDRVVRAEPGLQVLLPAAHGMEAPVRRLAAGMAGTVRVLAASGDEPRERQKWCAFCAGDLALAASGSVSLELAVAGLPTVLAYRVAPPTWWLATRMTRHRTAGLANILAGSEVQPEFLQGQCRPEPIATALLALLADPARRAALAAAAGEAAARVAPPGGAPSAAAAEAVLRLLDRHRGAGAAPAGEAR